MAAPRKRSQKSASRTPLAEWVAAGLGLALTLTVLGYSLWEATVDRHGPPDLVVRSEPAERTAQGFVVPVVVENGSYATAAGVEVRARLEDGAAVETRALTFTYVPGGGEARGGVVFLRDPSRGRVVLEIQGFEDP